ncbi:MAG: coproporphyrinogen III oxidase family protein, partial [bacterium]|nr:coproporphyrinogen III oxidase family protein [bacterium]
RYWKKPAAAEMMVEEPVNIYIHIPFCAQKCAYCYYKTEKYKSPHQLADYTGAVCREIRMAGERFHFSKRPVHTVYIGGGTPSLLRNDMLTELVECIKENFNVENPEFNIEAEPRTITEKKVHLYKDLGVTRISLGVQSFDDGIIKASGRLHSAEKALNAIGTIRGVSGAMVINIDLLSGLAGESNETWVKSVDTAIGTGVHNITVYRMEAYLNTEFFDRGVRKQEIQLPTGEQELHFMELAMERFGAADYRPWSFFTYTAGGNYHHGYATNLWKGEDCCAFGASAFGMLGRFNYQNAGNLDSYMGMTADGKLPVVRAHKLTGKDLMVKDLLMGMKLAVFDRGEYAAKHGVDFCEVLPGTVEELQAGGFIRLKDNAVVLDFKGLLYGDYVGKRFAFALKKYLGPDDFNIY